MTRAVVATLLLGLGAALGCRGGGSGPAPPALPCAGGHVRPDGACELAIALPAALAATGASLQNPCFSPDGRQLVVTEWLDHYNHGNAALLLVDIASGAATALTHGDFTDVNMPGACWHRGADGDRIAYASTHTASGDEGIFTMAAGGAKIQPVAAEPGFILSEPVLSPDGKRLAYQRGARDTVDANEIWLVTAGANDAKRISLAGENATQPNWCDGEVLFQVGAENARHVLFAVAPDSGKRRRISDGSANDTDASYSPDCQRIVDSSDYGGIDRANLFVIAADGSGSPRRASNAAVYDGAVSWSPDGGVLAFESGDGAENTGATTIWLIAAP